jgi:hypothetical protein
MPKSYDDLRIVIPNHVFKSVLRSRAVQSEQMFATEMVAEGTEHLPRLWELLGYLLSREARDRYFEPIYRDLIADYWETRQAAFQTIWAQRWLNICFVCRTVGLVLTTVGVMLRSRMLGVLLGLVPPSIREQVSDWWHNLLR